VSSGAGLDNARPIVREREAIMATAVDPAQRKRLDAFGITDDDLELLRQQSGYA